MIIIIIIIIIIQYIIFHTNATQTVQVISPLMPWRQDPLLVYIWMQNKNDVTWSPGQGATPLRGAPGWLALNPVGGMREPPSGLMQLQKLQFQSAIYGNPEHSNWHQSFPTHIWLFLAQCGMLAGFTKTMQAE